MKKLTDKEYNQIKELAEMYIRLVEAQKGSGFTDGTILTKAKNCLDQLLEHNLLNEPTTD